MNSPDKPLAFARWVFWIAGVYGLLILSPFYFMEKQIGVDQPPPITHPEFFYGFIGVALVFQLVYLTVGVDPIRYRPMMPLAVFAKSSFGIACAVLYLQGRLPGAVMAFAGIDLLLGALFMACYLRTPRR